MNFKTAFIRVLYLMGRSIYDAASICWKYLLILSYGVLVFSLFMGSFVVVAFLLMYATKIPYHIGDVLNGVYVFLVGKSIFDLFAIRLRFWREKENIQELMYPFLLLGRDYKLYRPFGLEWLAGLFVFQFFRPIAFLFFGRQMAVFLGKTVKLFYVPNTSTIDAGVKKFFTDTVARTTYLSYSINGVLLTLFIAIAGFAIALLSVSDDRLIRLYAFSNADKYIEPIVGYMNPVGMMRGFECKGAVRIDDAKLPGIQSAISERRKQPSYKKDRSWQGESRVNENLQKQIVSETLVAEFAPMDPKISTKDIGYLPSPTDFTHGTIIFETATDLVAKGFASPSIFGLKCQKYDIDNYLLDKIIITIVLLLFLSTVIFFALVLAISLFVTLVNFDKYVNRKYYECLLDQLE